VYFDPGKRGCFVEVRVETRRQRRAIDVTDSGSVSLAGMRERW
jgi:hypothetical protein